MYDGALLVDGTFVGIDVSAKRSGDAGYSDGGICSVADLLRFLVRSNGLFLIAQVRYESLETGTKIDSVRVAPLHCPPLDDFGIANLGTGQVRLKRPLDVSWDEIMWERTSVEFLDHFALLAVDFYEGGADRMLARRNAVRAMVESGFTEIRIK
jgi:hypothetical protein